MDQVSCQGVMEMCGDMFLQDSAPVPLGCILCVPVVTVYHTRSDDNLTDTTVYPAEVYAPA